MTFKHMKFEDSPTMRALEKVAKEKGLVKPEPLQKKAAVTKKADYTPSENLMENIFKLCAGLRDNGLKKEADEIEMNYLNLKRAQTLYETSKETGDDLIHAAHPKGSHKLEGVEGDEYAVVEDILDQHIKIVEKITKKPTGKLSSAGVINAVKKALGQEDPTAQKYSPELIGNWYRVQTANKLYTAQTLVSSDAAGILQSAVRAGFMEQSKTIGADYEDIAKYFQAANNANATMRNGSGGKAELNVNGCNAMIEAYESAIMKIQEAFGFTQDTNASNMRDNAISKIRTAILRIKECINTIQAYNADPNSLPIGVLPPQITQTQKQQVDFKGQVNALDQRFNFYANMHFEDRVPPASKPKIVNFLAGVKKNLDLLKSYTDKKDTDLATIKADLDKLIADVTSKLNYFKTAIVDKAPTQ